MTNPNNIVRLHSRNGGRGSVYEANEWAQVYGTGNLTGATVAPSSGLTVEISGSTASPSVVIAENNVGYKIALDLVTTTTLTLTAPTTNSKITAIVAYTNDLTIASTDADVTGNPSSCGLIAVDGTTAATPAKPTDSQIRTAITADGATGSQAVYAVLAYITIASNTTEITDSLINSPAAEMDPELVDFTKAFPKSASINQSLSHGMAIRIYRVGNLVFTSGSPINSSSIPQSTLATMTETIPQGYRPSGNISRAISLCGITQTRSIAIVVDSDGTMHIECPTEIGYPNRFTATAIWTTNDPWPED